jgi:hypothetical protein
VTFQLIKRNVNMINYWIWRRVREVVKIFGAN